MHSQFGDIMIGNQTVCGESHFVSNISNFTTGELGYQEVIVKEYGWERLGPVHMRFESFNGDIKVIPNATFTDSAKPGNCPLVRVTLKTSRPKEDSLPIEITEGLSSQSEVGVRTLSFVAKRPNKPACFHLYVTKMTVEISSDYALAECGNDELLLRTSNGDIEILGLGLPSLQSIRGYSTNGDIEAGATCSNFLEFITTNGNVKVSINSSSAPKQTTIKSTNGNVALKMHNPVQQLRFSLNTSNGKVSAALPHSTFSKEKCKVLEGVCNFSPLKNVAEHIMNLKSSNDDVKLLLNQ